MVTPTVPLPILRITMVVLSSEAATTGIIKEEIKAEAGREAILRVLISTEVEEKAHQRDTEMVARTIVMMIEREIRKRKTKKIRRTSLRRRARKTKRTPRTPRRTSQL